MSISFVYPQYLWLLILIPALLGLKLVVPRSSSRFRYWAGTAIRLILLLCTILALASVQLKFQSNLLTTIFVYDVSDSLSPQSKERGLAFIRSALQHMGMEDQAAVVVFGEDALVERLVSHERLFNEQSSIPVTTRTNISDALQLAQALFPNEGARRIVLLSDGQQNIGQALDQAELLSANQIEITYYPLAEETGTVEVYIDYLESPPEIRQGEDILLDSSIYSSSKVQAVLRLYGDGELIQTKAIILSPGTTRVQFKVDFQELVDGDDKHRKYFRFKLQVLPANDFRLQNNEAHAFTIIHGPPAILLVESHPRDSSILGNVLESAGMEIATISPGSIPVSLPELANYQAVILINVPSASLSMGVMDLLKVYVRDLGMGFIMVGGPDSYGAGGYLRTPIEEILPVSMDIKNRQLQANLALVLAVDKSGSMGRCHCDNPDLNQTYTRTEIGQPKVDIAKEAIMRAAGALGEQDYLGVVAFNESAHWSIRVTPLLNPAEIENAIGSIIAEGNTNLEPGVTAAYSALEGIQAGRKHIILLTDGWVRQGDLTSLADEMNSKGITLSVVATGEGSADYLKALAGVGGGRFYPATNMLNVPEILLQETIETVGEFIIEEAFFPIPAVPSSILRGIDTQSFPHLLGYNGTSTKVTARQELLTHRGDPLLATWQYGLGRSAAWTSDFRGQWTKEWLDWNEFSRFVAQMVNWVLPSPGYEGLEATAVYHENEAIIQLKAFDQAGLPKNFLHVEAVVVDPGLVSERLALNQTGVGLYQGRKRVSQPGTYLIRLGVNQKDQSLGHLTLGLVVPYSPEYKSTGANHHLLESLARLTGGIRLSDPRGSFLHDLPSQASTRPVWYPLLLLATLLFPLDIAIRRVNLNSRELMKFVESFKFRTPIRKYETPAPTRFMQSLFTARDRARNRQNVHGDDELPAPVASHTPDSIQDHLQSNSKDEDHSSNENLDFLARLRLAKKRANTSERS